ncbi:MAG: MoaD/ThiS family protein [Rubrivivax sp.]|nr:MoaD/ThiS family protein [Rubrivivax sp.]
MTTTAIRRTMRAQWAHVGAMHVELDHRDLRAVGEFLTINDLAPTHGRPVVCCINGEYIARADWWQPVRSGDVVVFAELAGSGDNGRLLATLLVAVAAAYTGGASTFAQGGSWAGWGGVASAAVPAVGGLRATWASA